MADGQLNATQQLNAAVQAINSGAAKLEWRTIGSGEGSSLAQVLVGNDGTVFEDVQAKDLGGGNVQLVTSAPAGTGGNNPYVGITTSVNPNTGTVAPLTSNNQVAIDYNPSKDNSILGLSHDQLMAAAIASMGGLMYSGVDLAAAGAGAGGFIATTQNLGSSSGTANYFGVGIIDILDYANTNKYKTLRGVLGLSLNAADASGSFGRVNMSSGSWRNTNAISSITLYPTLGTGFTQYSSFALYGIKRAGA